MSFFLPGQLPGAIAPTATNAFGPAFDGQPRSLGYADNGEARAFRSLDTAQSQYPGQGNANFVAQPPYQNQNGGGFDGLISSLQNLMSGAMTALQQMLGYLNGDLNTSQQTSFSNVSVSSTGDPHLAVNGTAENGSTLSGHFDSMTSHRDLIDSDSFGGGFRVSTQATTPNASGITYNKSATITSNYGQNVITMDASGNPSVTSNGRQIALTTGQPATLDGGEIVTTNADGSLSVTMDNGQGGTLTTTLRSNGAGVDVSATGSNVDLGGYIVNHDEKTNGWTTLSGKQVGQAGGPGDGDGDGGDERIAPGRRRQPQFANPSVEWFHDHAKPGTDI